MTVTGTPWETITLRINTTAGWIVDSVIMGRDGTVAYGGSDLPTTGYFVGGLYKSLILEDASAVRLHEVASFVTNSPAVDYYGVWTDQEDGAVYIDGVNHYESLEEALLWASEREEIAIWDIARGEEIRLGGLTEI